VCADTDSSGAYTIAGLASGEYKVWFSDDGKGYHLQYYDGAYWEVSAAPVVVTAGEISDGIDAQLNAGGGITGTVRAAATGDPLAGVEICARDIPPEGEFGGLFSSCAQTGATGEYAIARLAPGEYEVSFSAPNQTFARVTKTVIVAGESADEGVDAAMVVAGKISGVVTDESGADLAGVEVCALATVSEGTLGGCAETNRKGDYTIAGLEGKHCRVSPSTSPAERLADSTGPLDKIWPLLEIVISAIGRAVPESLIASAAIRSRFVQQGTSMCTTVRLLGALLTKISTNFCT